jgi:ssDNA-binding Zn-finger/Zn-ribbon topoisomerase 1
MKTQSEGRGGTSGAKAAPEMRDCPRCGKPTTVWRGKWGNHWPPSTHPPRRTEYTGLCEQSGVEFAEPAR